MMGDPPRRRFSRSEKDAVLAQARRNVRDADEIIKGPNIVRNEAYAALFAIRKMFFAAKPALARMPEDDRRAWETRQKLLEVWLQQIGERGI
jgi:hypothetical protein